MMALADRKDQNILSSIKKPFEGMVRVFEATHQFVRADPFRVGLVCGSPAAEMACPAPCP